LIQVRSTRVLIELPMDEALDQWTSRIHSAVTSFGQGRLLADDLTLLMLRQTKAKVNDTTRT
jgi:hypothetical protein